MIYGPTFPHNTHPCGSRTTPLPPPFPNMHVWRSAYIDWWCFSWVNKIACHSNKLHEDTAWETILIGQGDQIWECNICIIQIPATTCKMLSTLSSLCCVHNSPYCACATYIHLWYTIIFEGGGEVATRVKPWLTWPRATKLIKIRVIVLLLWMMFWAV